MDSVAPAAARDSFKNKIMKKINPENIL